MSEVMNYVLNNEVMNREVGSKEIILEDILKKKENIEFCSNNGSIWYTTIVESVKGNEVTLAFPEMFAAVEIILEDTLVCRFSDDNYQYTFEGNIESIRIYFPQQIKLKLIGQVEKFENIRRAKREETLFLANVFTKNEEVYHSCVCDVSKTGVKVISKFQIEQGTEVGVHIVLPLRNIFDSIVKMEGKIVWARTKTNRNEYGIDITHMEEVYRTRLEQFLATYAK